MQNQEATTVEDSQLGLKTPEKYEQHCILFPTYATKHADDGSLTDNWNIRVRGWAFSSPTNSRSLSLFLKLTSKVRGLKKDDPTYEMLQSRVSLFWASNITGAEFTVQTIGTTESNKMAIEVLEKAGKIIENTGKINMLKHPDYETKSTKISCNGGQFTGTIGIPQSTIKKWVQQEERMDLYKPHSTKESKSKVRLIKIQAYDAKISQPAHGVVNLIGSDGISVISDIDDTIKETDVMDGVGKVLTNTFLQPTKAVDGMADAYRSWYEKGIAIHYVSNSPWQLFPMLRNFFKEYNFPPGSAHLKFYDGLIKSAREQKENPTASKFMYIRELLKDFPQRKFILVGDSGELDPEIYTTIAREHPDRIVRIFIRDVSTKHIKDLPAQPPKYSYVHTFPSLVKNLKSYYQDSGKEDKADEKNDNLNEEMNDATPTEIVDSPIADKNSSRSVKSQKYTPSSLLENLRSDLSYLRRTSTPGSRSIPRAPSSANVQSPTEDSVTDESNADSSSSSSGKPLSSSTSGSDKPTSGSDKPTSGSDKPASEQLKTPLEMFHERIANLTAGLPEGLFSLFNEASELGSDTAVAEAIAEAIRQHKEKYAT
ncbi:6104_t:CDS:2 [Paraglomus occultum]|uniref:6104_t:CDS:1 n=1 Tax=Paraglomus occultum TaxID=144539 RepID=A0A9N9C0G7_9GLOM|nr:6104_t:CDS:2 [Paraglomus occultum]